MILALCALVLFSNILRPGARFWIPILPLYVLVLWVAAAELHD